jgi:uncharacterized protein YceH (UPF0502 family)
MSIALDATERRVLGSLVEKDLSVPESYPLTLNALLAACNQKSNRDPETEYAEHEVVGALRALMQRGWVTENERSGGRTARYAHRAREMLAVDDVDAAILAELLLRGPQSAMELKTRASRMRPVASPEEAERRLEALAARPVPYVRLLGRRAGERVPRWEHLLAKEPAGAAPAPTTAPSPRATPAAAPGSPDPAADDLAAAVADLRARLDRLEREVADLRART